MEKRIKKYPETAKITYWFPTIFVLGFLFSLLILCFGYWCFIAFYILYFIAIFVDSYRQNKSIKVASLSKLTTLIQFFGYGFGFLKSFLNFSK